MDFNFDYWMYKVLEKALYNEIKDNLKNKHFQEEWEHVKNNKFHHLGKLNLTHERIKNVKELHSLVIEGALFDTKIERDKHGK